MARGTGVFMPRSYEDVTCTSKAPSSSAGQRQPQTCSGFTGHEARSTSSHASRSDRGGSAEGSTQELKALARAGTTSHSGGSNIRSGITLRRVPWGSAQGSGSSSSSGITSRHSSSGTLTLTVGSCPDTSSLLLRQPPPPPPAPAAAARHQAIRRSSTASSGSASPSRPGHFAAVAAGAAAPAVLAHTSSSEDVLVVRQHLPSPGYESHVLPPSALQVPPAPRLSACSWEDVATTPGAAADASLSANTLWPFSPDTQAAAADGLPELSTAFRSSGALTLDATNSSSTMTPPAGRRPLQLEGDVGAATAWQQQQQQQQQHIFSAAAVVDELGMHTSAAAAGPWASQSLDLSLSSSFHSCPLLTLMPTPTATAAPTAGGSPTVHSGGSLVSAAAGGSWMGPVVLGQPYDTEYLVLQDTLLLSGSLEPGSFMGGTALSTAHLAQQQQQQASNGLLHQAEWDVLLHNTPPGGGGPLSAVLAAPTTTPAAAAAVAQRSAFAQAAVCRAPSLLDGCGSGLGVLPGYPDVLHSTTSLHQQLQLANSSLGFTTNCPAPAAVAKSSASAPISIPAALGRTQGMQATAAAAVQQGPHTPSVLQPHSAGTTHAVAVAQMKLQQLMAVERIQQQLQEEVMRLLPLI